MDQKFELNGTELNVSRDILLYRKRMCAYFNLKSVFVFYSFFFEY